jgi:hypothetical protein
MEVHYIIYYCTWNIYFCKPHIWSYPICSQQIYLQGWLKVNLDLIFTKKSYMPESPNYHFLSLYITHFCHHHGKALTLRARWCSLTLYPVQDTALEFIISDEFLSPWVLTEQNFMIFLDSESVLKGISNTSHITQNAWIWIDLRSVNPSTSWHHRVWNKSSTNT